MKNYKVMAVATVASLAGCALVAFAVNAGMHGDVGGAVGGGLLGGLAHMLRHAQLEAS